MSNLLRVTRNSSSLTSQYLSVIVQQDATIYILLYFCKLLHMSRVVTPPIIRSRPVPDAVIRFTCAPDDGWSYHPKHVEQFTKI